HDAWRALSLSQDSSMDGGSAGECFLADVGPDNFDRLYPCSGTEAEMHAGIVAAEVTVTRADRAPLPSAAGTDHYLRTVSIPLQRRVDRANQQPMASRCGHVPVQASWPGHGRHQKIQRAIAIQVPTSQTSGDSPSCTEGGVVRGD